jgi:hypothetical protein
MLAKHGYEGNVKPKPKINYKKNGLGCYKGGKINDRKVVKGKECVMFIKGPNLDDLMNIAHGVTTTILMRTSQL